VPAAALPPQLASRKQTAVFSHALSVALCWLLVTTSHYQLATGH